MNDLSALEIWTSWLSAEGRSLKTVTTYMEHLRVAARWLGSVRGVGLLAAQGPDLLALVASMRERRLSPWTVASRRSAFMSFWRWAARSGFIASDPSACLPKVRTPPPRPCAISADQARELCDLPSTRGPRGIRNRAILRLLTESGLRRSEIASLQMDDLDMGRLVAFVVCGKGGEPREVPFGPGAAQCVEAWLRARARLNPPNRWLFCDIRRGHLGQLQPASITRAVSTQGKKLRLPDRRYPSGARIGAVHAHTLRHTCATMMLQAGDSIPAIQAQLGHRNVATTSIYLRVTEGELHASAQRRSALLSS